jgi:uncharacterized membrane protein YqjE
MNITKNFISWIYILSTTLLCISLFGLFTNAPHATDAYLNSWSFWLEFPLGALAIHMLHELTGGKWGISAKPILCSMMKCLWVLPLLFLPLIFKTTQIFPWLQDQSFINQNSILKFRQHFYQGSYFGIRAYIYFAIFIFINWRAKSLSRGPYTPAWGLVLYVITMSLASMDWYMSREPEWYSTIYSLIWIMAQICSAFAVILVVKFPNFIKTHLQLDQIEMNRDHGTIFFVFLISWIYLAFMQFLIIWSANLPKEISWYVLRLNSSWGILSILILLGLFFIPFFLLLSRDFKARSKSLAILAMLFLFFRYLDTSWTILPAGRDHCFFTYWDLISFLGIAGFPIGIFLKELKILHDKHNDLKDR